MKEERPTMPRLPGRCVARGLVKCSTSHENGRFTTRYEFLRHGRTIRLALIESDRLPPSRRAA